MFLMWLFESQLCNHIISNNNIWWLPSFTPIFFLYNYISLCNAKQVKFAKMKCQQVTTIMKMNFFMDSASDCTSKCLSILIVRINARLNMCVIILSVRGKNIMFYSFIIICVTHSIFTDYWVWLNFKFYFYHFYFCTLRLSNGIHISHLFIGWLVYKVYYRSLWLTFSTI